MANESNSEQGEEPPIMIGDAVLDLAQGRTMQVVGKSEMNAGEWSEANSYDLTGNYGNARLGASEEDTVFDCVYTGSIKSEPSKTYAFPESRLARIEVEAADDELTRVQHRVARGFLIPLLIRAKGGSVPPSSDAICELMEGIVPQSVIEEADEIAEAERIGEQTELGDN